MKFLYIFIFSLGIGITLSQLSTTALIPQEQVYLQFDETIGIHFESREHPFFAASAEPVVPTRTLPEENPQERNETQSDHSPVSIISESTEPSALEVKDAAMGILHTLFRLFLELYQ